jgi:A/G-specific adenine glycosylase
MSISQQQIADFQKVVKDYYAQAGRHDLAWRKPEPTGDFDPYKILVSELMLQQTQVSRVTPKFTQFLELFPTIETLAASSLAAVLTCWSGLGYNRRAKFLHQAAQQIQHEFDGRFPTTIDELVRLPGVGKNTAGAIVAYAFNQPVVFVETNIRTAYFYHFFMGRGVVSDGEVAALVEQTLNHAHPREWYWALMDYGAYLKSTGKKLNKLSKYHTKQAPFEGSKRQVRGKVIRTLATQAQTLVQLQSVIPDSRLGQVLDDLLYEGLISKKSDKYNLCD